MINQQIDPKSMLVLDISSMYLNNQILIQKLQPLIIEYSSYFEFLLYEEPSLFFHTEEIRNHLLSIRGSNIFCDNKFELGFRIGQKLEKSESVIIISNNNSIQSNIEHINFLSGQQYPNLLKFLLIQEIWNISDELLETIMRDDIISKRSRPQSEAFEKFHGRTDEDYNKKLNEYFKIFLQSAAKGDNVPTTITGLAQSIQTILGQKDEYLGNIDKEIFGCVLLKRLFLEGFFMNDIIMRLLDSPEVESLKNVLSFNKISQSNKLRMEVMGAKGPEEKKTVENSNSSFTSINQMNTSWDPNFSSFHVHPTDSFSIGLGSPHRVQGAIGGMEDMLRYIIKNVSQQFVLKAIKVDLPSKLSKLEALLKNDIKQFNPKGGKYTRENIWAYTKDPIYENLIYYNSIILLLNKGFLKASGDKVDPNLPRMLQASPSDFIWTVNMNIGEMKTEIDGLLVRGSGASQGFSLPLSRSMSQHSGNIRNVGMDTGTGIPPPPGFPNILPKVNTETMKYIYQQCQTIQQKGEQATMDLLYYPSVHWASLRHISFPEQFVQQIFHKMFAFHILTPIGWKIEDLNNSIDYNKKKVELGQNNPYI